MEFDKDIALIKQSFDSAPIEKAPELWQHIAKELDEDDLTKKIKNSFDTMKVHKAPLMNFDNLLADDVLFNIVKGSFEGTRVGAPDSVWENVQNGLYVNGVWDNISDKIIVGSNKWQAAVVAASIAFMLLIIPFSVKDVDLNQYIFQQDLLSNYQIHEESNSLESIEKNEIKTVLLEEDETDQNFCPKNDSSVINEEIKIESGKEWVDIADVVTLESTTISPISWQPKTNAIEFELEQKEKNRWKFSLGGIAGLNRTWILDNETRASFERETLLDSKFSLGEMYGISAEAELNDKFSFSANFLFNSRLSNKIGYFDNGVYKIKTTKIDFYKSSFLFGRKFNFSTKRTNFDFVTKAGLYFGINKRSSVQDQELLTSFNSAFKRLDYGLNVQVGNEHDLNKFTLGYGVNSEFGFQNLFKGNGYIPAKLNYSNNASLGLYLSLRYNFQ